MKTIFAATVAAATMLAAAAQAQDWSAAANQDLQAIHDALRDNAPQVYVERDSASFTTCDNSQASTISAIATMTTMTAPQPELLLSLLEEEELDEDDDEEDQPLLPDEFHSRLVNRRKNSSPKKPTTPAMMTATTISCTSPLRIWVSS